MVTAVTSTAHEITTPGRPRTEEVSEGVHAYIQPDGTWWINNTGFLVGAKGVISVDSCSTVRRTRAYLAAIADVTAQPVRTLINTHHHGDHTYGNFLFPGATIVGHEATRSSVLQWGMPFDEPVWTRVEWGDVELAPPFLTYRDGVTVWVDDLRCEVSHVGTAAHTTNDSIVWLPERKVLFGGDLLFKGGTPFLMQGSLAGAITVLEKTVRPLGAETIVPGHGPVCGPEVIDEVLSYLYFVRQTALDGKAAGLTPLEAARQADLGQFADLKDAERLAGNLHRAYAELDGAAPGAQIDVMAAIGDMITLNGGKPLSCSA